jgi:hypothetical protein
MLLDKEVSNYVKGKIKWNSYFDKELVQYVLELYKLDDYIRNWFKWPYYVWFGLDYLMEKHFDDYIELLKEIKWEEESEKTKANFNKKEKLLCKWIDFSHSWELENLQGIWIELWWSK